MGPLVCRHICLPMTPVALVQGKKVLIVHCLHFIKYNCERLAVANHCTNTQLQMKRKCKCAEQKTNRHLALLIVSSSWLTLIKNSISLTMLINSIQRLINRRAHKSFFEISKHPLSSMDRMHDCSRTDKCFFFCLIYFIFYQRKKLI